MTLRKNLAAWLLALAVLGPSTAAAAELLDETTMLEGVKASVLPATLAELTEGGFKDAAAAWTGAKPGNAVLVWGYVQEAQRLEPAYWLVSIRSGSKLVGLLAVDPQDATLSWRATRLSPRHAAVAEALLSGPKAAVDKARKETAAESLKQVDAGAALAVSVNGAFYWMLPTVDENIPQSLCIAVDGTGSPIMLWEAVARGQGLRPFQGKDLASDIAPEIPPAPTASGADKGITWMAGEVPTYASSAKTPSWAAALAALHQWWSPVPLDAGASQAKEMADYLGRPASEPVYLHQAGEVMRSWNRVAQKAGRKTGYQPFRRVWFGKGGTLDGPVAWRTSDIRAWIAYEAPVLLAVDADGRGPDEGVDQALLAVGYSNTHRTVYVVNPWGPADTYSFDSLSRHYWSAWYNVSCDLPSLCATKTMSRRGMVAGTPGDLVGPATPVPVFAAPQAVSDSQVATISSIGVHVAPPLVEAFGGQDEFGETYATECALTIPDAKPAGGAKKGSWEQLGERPSKEALLVSASGTRMIYPGTVFGGGQIDVTFTAGADLKSVTVQARCKAFDGNDRTHLQEGATIEVRDDATEVDGRKAMRKPLLLSRADSVSLPVQIFDDDPAPPSIRLLSPDVVFDSQKGAYRLEVSIDDVSGVRDVGVKWAFGGKQPPGGFESMSKGQGQVYTCEVSRGDWVQHVGETLRFWVTGTDADEDSAGDSASAVEVFDISIQDDDAVGPLVVQQVVQPAENNQFQVLVQLADASEILVTESWPKLYYSFSENLSLDKFNGVTKLVRAPKYGEGWFTAVAPWGEEGILDAEEQKGKKLDTLIFFKVRAIDKDNDREGDESDSWSSPWWGVYLAASVDDRKTITDIWPAGENAVVEKVWDHWFELPPADLAAGLFIEAQPTETSPPSMPDILPGGATAIRLHFYLTRLAVSGGVTVTVGGSSAGSKPFALKVSLVSRKGVRTLSTFTYKTQAQGGGGEQSVTVPASALSTGENILVLEPAPQMKPSDSFVIERILIER